MIIKYEDLVEMVANRIFKKMKKEGLGEEFKEEALNDMVKCHMEERISVREQEEILETHGLASLLIAITDI